MATLGYDGITPAFNSFTTVSALRRGATKFTATEAGTITAVQFNLDYSQDELMFECFADAAGSPGALIGNSPPQQQIIAPGPYTMVWSGLSIPFSAGPIWLGWHSNTSFTSHVNEFDGGGASYAFKNGVAFTDPAVDPFGTPDGTDDRLLAILATYTPSGAAAVLPTSRRRSRGTSW
jgi:hypothetical protein